MIYEQLKVLNEFMIMSFRSYKENFVFCRMLCVGIRMVI